ncbi:hypothetical protein HFO90_24150 [Rhizobium leguminosarum]|nr:hypothetical protein [Rhizobium leguminosarum]
MNRHGAQAPEEFREGFSSFDQLDGEIWFNGEFVAWERRQDPRINVAIAIGHWSSHFNPTE